MSSPLTPIGLDMQLEEGCGFDDVFYWALDAGFSYWFAGRTYAANAVVKSWPDSDPSTSLFFRALGGGTTGSLPPTWPTQPGETVTDAGGVTWIAQTDSRYPVDLSAASAAVMKFAEAPDSPGPALLALTLGQGITLDAPNASVRVQLTPTDATKLLAVRERGAVSMHITFPTGPEPAMRGGWFFERLPSGR